MNTIPPTDDFPHPQLDCPDPRKPWEIASYLESNGVKYGLGAKDPNLQSLVDFKAIDCSGFRDVCLFHMTGGDLNLGVGQENSQYVKLWEDAGFKESTPGEVAGSGNLYIFTLPASLSHDGIGHTGFTDGETTAESYGGHGPGSRPWDPDNVGWQGDCRLWCLKLA